MNTLNNIMINNKKTNTDDYMDIITKKCTNSIPEVKKLLKLNEDTITIPTIKSYQNIIKYNYNISQLKIIAKNYKLKISGNKPQLVLRIFSYLYFSTFIIKIQKYHKINQIITNQIITNQIITNQKKEY
jgi:hypothetical protein